MVATDIVAADEEGTSDAFVVIKCAGQTGQTKVRPATLNPRWYETIIMEVELPPFEGNSEVPAGLSLVVYDDDDYGSGNVKKAELIGRIWIEIQPNYHDFIGKFFSTIY